MSSRPSRLSTGPYVPRTPVQLAHYKQMLREDKDDTRLAQEIKLNSNRNSKPDRSNTGPKPSKH